MDNMAGFITSFLYNIGTCFTLEPNKMHITSFSFISYFHVLTKTKTKKTFADKSQIMIASNFHGIVLHLG